MGSDKGFGRFLADFGRFWRACHLMLSSSPPHCPKCMRILGPRVDTTEHVIGLDARAARAMARCARVERERRTSAPYGRASSLYCYIYIMK